MTESAEETVITRVPLNVEKVMEETDQVEIVPVEEAPAEETAAE